MFKKPIKRETPKPVRLDPAYAIPEPRQMRVVLGEALKERGILVELPISVAGEGFLLTCQWGSTFPQPSWTLFEGEEGKTVIWNYEMENIDMLQGILAMSIIEKVPEANSITTMPDEVTSRSTGSEATSSNPWLAQLEQSAATAGWNRQADGTASSGGWGNPEASGWTHGTGGGQPSPGSPTTPFSAQQSGLEMPQAESVFKQHPGEPNTGWGQHAHQRGQSSPFSPAELANAGSWTPDILNDQRYPVPGQPGVVFGQPGETQSQPAPPYGQPPAPGYGQLSPLHGQPGSHQKNPSPTERSACPQLVDYLETNPAISMGELIVGAVSMPAALLDAAMRLQEMVCTGRFDDALAVQILKHIASTGAELDDGLISDLKAKARGSTSDTQAEELLQTAGIDSSDEHLKEQARESLRLINDGKLRQDQAIIALHYCQRARSRLADALSDMGIDV